MVQLQESFPFGDGRELFNIALKYANWRTPMSTKIFEPSIFVDTQGITKIHENMKIWSHKVHYGNVILVAMQHVGSIYIRKLYNNIFKILVSFLYLARKALFLVQDL